MRVPSPTSKGRPLIDMCLSKLNTLTACERVRDQVHQPDLVRTHINECIDPSDASLSFSGSNQAREGRLVNALAVRGDERRDTLR